MKLGYCRVSKHDQNLNLQLEALRSAGVEQIFEDKISATCRSRIGLNELLQIARKGDIVYIWRFDRLARSLEHLLELAREFDGRGVAFVSLTEGFDTSTAVGKMCFQMIGAIAEFERNLIAERTAAGLDAAKAQGKVGGRKPVLNDDKKKTLDLLLFEKIIAETGGEIYMLKQDPDFHAAANAIGVSERTVRRYAQGDYKK